MGTQGTCGRCGTPIRDNERPQRDPDDGELYHADCWDQEVRGR